MNLLQISQRIFREAGYSGSQPSSVDTSTLVGSQRRCVEWAIDAWTEILAKRDDWLFLWDRFSFDTTSGYDEYTVDPAASDQLDEWGLDTITIYKTADGLADQGALPFIPWKPFKRTWKVGSVTWNRPQEFSINPLNYLVLGPTPDIGGYTISGEYRKKQVIPSLSTDTPPWNANLHMIVVWKAMEYVAHYENEAWLHRLTYEGLFDRLERKAKPAMCAGGALA